MISKAHTSQKGLHSDVEDGGVKALPSLSFPGFQILRCADARAWKYPLAGVFEACLHSVGSLGIEGICKTSAVTRNAQTLQSNGKKTYVALSRTRKAATKLMRL